MRATIKYGIAGVLLLGFISSGTYDPAWGNFISPTDGVGNFFGVIGALLTSTLIMFVGMCAYSIPLTLLFFEHKKTQSPLTQIIFLVVFSTSLSVFVSAFFWGDGAPYFFIYGSIGLSAQILFDTINTRLFLTGITGLNLLFLFRTLKVNQKTMRAVMGLFGGGVTFLWVGMIAVQKKIKTFYSQINWRNFKTFFPGMPSMQRKRQPTPEYVDGGSGSSSASNEKNTSDDDREHSFDNDGLSDISPSFSKKAGVSIVSDPDCVNITAGKTDDGTVSDTAESRADYAERKPTVASRAGLTPKNAPRPRNESERTDINRHSDVRKFGDFKKNPFHFPESNYDKGNFDTLDLDPFKTSPDTGETYSQIFGKHAKSKYIQTVLKGLKPEDIYQVNSSMNDTPVDVLMSDLREPDNTNR